MLLRVWKLAKPCRLLQHGPLADRAINIFDFFHHLICCLLSSLVHCSNNGCTLFNSPRQWEVYRIIRGPWETVTVTLGVLWSYFSLLAKVVWCDRSVDQGGVCVCHCEIGSKWGEAQASQAGKSELVLHQSSAPLMGCVGDWYFGCKQCCSIDLSYSL